MKEGAADLLHKRVHLRVLEPLVGIVGQRLPAEVGSVVGDLLAATKDLVQCLPLVRVRLQQLACLVDLEDAATGLLLFKSS